MNEHEYRAHRATTIRDCIVMMATAAAVVALYHMSGSWHSLWAMSLIVLLGGLKSATPRKPIYLASSVANEIRPIHRRENGVPPTSSTQN